MPHFILVSDVFCPWCYGFAPVMRRLAAEHPDCAIRVLCGDLVEEPTTLAAMQQDHPNLRAFFGRLSRTTGQAVGETFLRHLEPGHGEALPLFSSALSAPLAALRTLAPGRELEQLEALQAAFYGAGLDVLNPEVQARTTGVEAEALAKASTSEAVLEAARRDRKEALEQLDEFVVYPSLFLETDDGKRHVLTRGYSAYETVAARLDAALGTKKTPEAARFPEGATPSANACGPDGTCPL